MLGTQDIKIRVFIVALGLVSMTALAGCDDAPQRIAYNPPQGGGGVPTSSTAPPVFSTPPPPAPTDPLIAGTDPLTGGGDPLTSHSNAAVSYSHNPLTADVDPQGYALDKMPNAARDALLSSPRMSTGHSHWATGQVFNATVTVTVNNVRLGVFNYPFDRDITSRCHPGVNQVTFEYKPKTNTSSAHVNILESEHSPPIAPLVVFNSPLSSTSHVGKPILFKKLFIAN